MKTTITLIMTLLLAGLGSALAAEHVWENFDQMPLGSVASQTNWTGFFAARTAQVSNAQAHSPSNSLRFPWNTNSPNATAATHTNLKVRLGGLTGNVMRVDFRLFIPSTNTPFAVALIPSSGNSLNFIHQGGVGRIGFDPYHATPVPLVPNGFVEVTMLYHAGRNQYALEYFGERVVDWAAAERATAATQFISAVFLRADDTLASQGNMYVDNLRVETYPYDVWAWWRFNGENPMPEQLGQFAPVWNTVLSSPAEAASDPIWDGWNEFHNEGAVQYVLTGSASNTVATPTTATWTLETVVRIAEDHTQTLFHWGRDLGYTSTQAMIELRYEATSGLRVLLRDGQQTTSEHFSQVTTPYAADGRWHHVALVKSGTDLLTYVDYQMVAATPLNAFARGNYMFGAGTHAAIGRTLNNANQARATTAMDEIRFSSRSLEPYDHLQPARPVVVRMDHDPGDNTWNMYFKGIHGRRYRIETSPVLGPGENWTVEEDDYLVNTTFSYFWAPASASKRFVQIIRK